MSIENAKAFYAKVKKDQDLFNKIGQIQQSDPEGLEAGIIKIAAENGYDFTAAEMKTFLEAEAKKVEAGSELSDDQLEAVAGGKSSGSIGAWVGVSIMTVGAGCAISGIVQTGVLGSHTQDNCGIG